MSQLTTIKQDEAFDTRSVVKSLEKMMNRVTEKECTPENVNAACNAAGRITDILRVHLELARIQIASARK